MSESTQTLHAVAIRTADMTKVHGVEELLLDYLSPAGGKEKRAELMVHVNKWGYQLCEALGKFIEQVLAAGTPLTTTIECSFNDMPGKPLMRLWATMDEQTPITRLPVVCAERDAARAERDALARAATERPLAGTTADGVTVWMGDRVWIEPIREGQEPGTWYAIIGGFAGTQHGLSSELKTQFHSTPESAWNAFAAKFERSHGRPPEALAQSAAQITSQ